MACPGLVLPSHSKAKTNLFWFYNVILPILLVILAVVIVLVAFNMPDNILTFIMPAIAGTTPLPPT